MGLNETHAPELRSWVESANAGSDFPIQNLPFGVFRRARSNEAYRCGVAIGDQIVDLSAALTRGLLQAQAHVAAAAGAGPALNGLMGVEPSARSALRLALSRLLRFGAVEREAASACLVPQAAAEYAVPAVVGDFSDFYSSIHHATRVGALFRPDNPLLPNFKWLPLGYHGRSSSIGVSGHAFARPHGQLKSPDTAAPAFGPCQRLDYELELGVFLGPGCSLGRPVPMADAEQHVFGLCLLNDWSARDIQTWEYQPLGPFLAKSFATTVSPWVVTLEALEPFRTGWTRPPSDPQPLAHLDHADLRVRGAFDIRLEVLLQTTRMKAAGAPPARVSGANARDAYWAVAQLIAHQTSNGCDLRPGDLIGTGTLSGPRPEEGGCLLELTAGGKSPIVLPNGEKRRFIEDGDTVIFRAWCETAGAVRIGFGECASTVVPRRECEEETCP